jgi:integrase/recombinase XerD
MDSATSLQARFEQFIRERQYITNVTPRTSEWHRNSLKWLPTVSPSQEELKNVLIRMREKGLQATGCNSAIRAINAYLHWNTGAEDKCSPACKHPRMPRLKEPDLVLPTFTGKQIRLLVKHQPKRKCQKRLHLLIQFLIDTGCRITEALSVHVREIDLENLLVTLNGKGRKQRIVPFSFELRKAIYHFWRGSKRTDDDLLFENRGHTKLDRCNVLRDVKVLCRNLGFKPPARTLHAFRHTFGVNYLRKGGSVFHLQKVLGHSTLEMTRRYANLVTADLSAMHERVSLLAGSRMVL